MKNQCHLCTQTKRTLLQYSKNVELQDASFTFYLVKTLADLRNKLHNWFAVHNLIMQYITTY